MLQKLLYAALGLALLVLTFSASNTEADNNNKVDCSSLKDWNSSSTYKKGDFVKAKSGVTQYLAKFKCTKDTCRGVGDNQPYHDNGKTWERVGVCK